jgi:predicted DNA-binding antitoxin AbrB/MazE fold protein
MSHRMNKTIAAVYERGVFRPTEPVSLTEGQGVQVTIPEDTAPDMMSPEEHARMVRRFEEIAALPIEGGDDGSGGDRHDEIIYGTQDDLG